MVRNLVLGFLVTALTSLAASPAAAADAKLAQQWVAYGQKLYAARQYDQAIKAFSTAARANSADAAAWKGLGNAYYAKRDYANAVKYYKYAIQLNPADTALPPFVAKIEAFTAQAGATANDPLTLAGRYYQARQYDYAIQAYNQAIAADPNNAKAYQGLGNAYYAKQDKPNAVNAYKRALELNPSNEGLRKFLAAYAPEAAGGAGATAAAGGPSDWFQPLWRSALVPGWGQGYNGSTTKGWILGVATIGALGGSVATYMIGSGARDKYRSLDASAKSEDFDAAYNTWDSMAKINNIVAIAWFALYTFNLIDAVVGAKPKAAYGMGGLDQDLNVALTPYGGLGVKYRLLQF